MEFSLNLFKLIKHFSLVNFCFYFMFFFFEDFFNNKFNNLLIKILINIKFY
jgi:hypothetical protein